MTYLVEGVLGAFKSDVPEEQVVVVLETNTRTEVIVVGDICKFERVRRGEGEPIKLTSELASETGLGK